jgi:hypothetical protein
VDLHAELRFAADPDTVAAMLADEGFVRQWCDETQAREVSISVERGAGRTPFQVRTSRAFPTDAFPSFARRFVGESLVIEQTDAWEPVGDGAWRGTSDVVTSGAPARLRARTSLDSAGEGASVLVVDGEVKASVPLVGGKIEELMHERVLKAMQVEERVAADWLTSR